MHVSFDYSLTSASDFRFQNAQNENIALAKSIGKFTKSSTFRLILLLLVYTLIGAWIFSWLEADHQIGDLEARNLWKERKRAELVFKIASLSPLITKNRHR